MDIPQPFEIKTVAPSSPGPSPWTEPTRHLREISRWMTGGVIATAAAVATGSSLTNLGSLDPANDLIRLSIAVVGLLAGVGAIGFILQRALGVLNIDVTTLDELADADPLTHLGETRATIEAVYRFLAHGFTWDEARKSGSRLGDEIERSLPYFHVRARFDKLVATLKWAGVLAIAGFVVFAWAANPPDRPTKPDKGVTIRIVG